jgi:hypothetical protein
MKKLIATAARALSFAGAAYAADGKGKYEVLGLGAQSCSEYNAIKADAEKVVGIWVEGYATALNQALPGTKDVTKGANQQQIMEKVSAACAASPDMMIADATRNVMIEMSGLKDKASVRTAKADESEAPIEAPALRQ